MYFPDLIPIQATALVSNNYSHFKYKGNEAERFKDMFKGS